MDRNRNRRQLRAAASDHHQEVHHGPRGGPGQTQSGRSSGPADAADGLLETDSDDSDSSGGDGGFRVYRCTQCDESFGSWRQLELHARCHVGEQRLRCHLCDRRFRLQAQLKQHLNTHLAEKPHACPDCGKTFLHKSSIRYHQLIHAGTKPHACGRCGRRFRSTSQRKVHMCAGDLKKPGKTNKLRCSECGEMFSKRLLLMVHERVHQGKRLFTCSFCGVQLLFRSCLEKHLRSHTGERPFGCTACHKRFRWSSQIKNHKCAPPLDPGKHACTQCGAAFPTKAKLLVHLRGHQGKKLYTCSFCGLQYQYKSQVERHMRSHTGEKLYGCTVCRKRFAHMGTARLHRLMHAQEKPFSCGDCGRSFSWRFQIKNHRCQSRGAQPGRKVTGRHQNHNFIRQDSDQTSEPPAERDDGALCRQTKRVRSRFTYQRKERVGERDRSLNPDQHGTPETRTRPRPLPKSANRELQARTEQPQSDRPTQRSAVRWAGPDDCETWRPPEANSRGGSYLKGHHRGQPERWHIKEELQEAKLGQAPAGPPPVRWPCGGPPGVPVKTEDNENSEQNRERPDHGSSRSGRCDNQLPAPRRARPTSPPRSTFSCSVCSATFAGTDGLILHMRSHARQTRFNCSVCDKDFSWRRHLTRHMEVHRLEDVEELHHTQIVQRSKIVCRTGAGQNPLVQEQPCLEDPLVCSAEPKEVKQENQEEPSHVKEEPQETQIRQTSDQQVCVTQEPCEPGPGLMKSEVDEKPHSAVVVRHVFPGPEAGPGQGPPDSSETDVSDEDWTDRRRTWPGAWTEAVQHQDSEDSDFWKDE